jgi:hypothetical protein
MLNQHYGTSKMFFLTEISAESNPSASQLRHVICATKERNPFMPQGPGRRGLLFSCRQQLTLRSPWSLFGRIRASEWEYEGEYECFRVGVLTPEDFIAQEEKVFRI